MPVGLWKAFPSNMFILWILRNILKGDLHVVEYKNTKFNFKCNQIYVIHNLKYFPLLLIHRCRNVFSLCIPINIKGLPAHG